MTFVLPATKQQALEQLARLIDRPPRSVGMGSAEPREALAEAAEVLGIATGDDWTKPQIAEAIASAGGLTWENSCDSRDSPSGGGGTVTLEGLNRVVAAALALRTAPADSKQEALNRIAALIGRPPRKVSTGSTEPREAFTDVVDALQLDINPALPKQELAEAIAKSGKQAWGQESDSRSTASGGGGTVTLVGLNRVLRAVGKLVLG